MKKAALWLLSLILLSISACEIRTGEYVTPESALSSPIAEMPASREPSAEPAPSPPIEPSSASKPSLSPDPSPISEQSPIPEPSPSPELEPQPVVLAFAGDVNLDDTWYIIKEMRERGRVLSDCFSPKLLERMRAADIFQLNNEFAFSDRGEPMENKMWTFRSRPENVELLLAMGADIVSLANNHVYDYGRDAFFDTLDTLKDAGVRYVGAGRDLNEAMTAQFYTVNGITFAYVSATRAEKFILTPAAAEGVPGVLRTYDSALFLEAIRAVKPKADVVIAIIHWGTEYSYELEEAQTTLAREVIDAGADIIIGSHPHCLQGIEFYNGKPVIYSLGNYWFNGETIETALLEVMYNQSGDVSLTVLPCMQTDMKVVLLSNDGERRELFGLIEAISPNADIRIDDNGLVTQTKP